MKLGTTNIYVRNNISENSTLTYFSCHVCEAWYEYCEQEGKDGWLVSMTLRTSARNQQFEVKLNYQKETTEIHYLKPFGESHKKRVHVQTFPFAANWTPLNIQCKLDTYLPFL